MMMMAGLGIICWILLRGKMNRKKRSQPAVQIPSLKHNANATATRAGHTGTFTGTNSLGAPTEVLKWQVELHDLGRELKGELDSKMLALQAMHRRCEQATQNLQHLLERVESQSAQIAPIDRAKALASSGWPNSKIATALSLDPSDVSTLLDVD